MIPAEAPLSAAFGLRRFNPQFGGGKSTGYAGLDKKRITQSEIFRL
jgi:hypothetical protein